MVRDLRVKSAIFPAFTVTGSVLSETYNQHVNGDIIRITVNNPSSPGSVWLAESGTNIEFWRRNNVTSGTAAFDAYPRNQIVDTTNGTIGNGSGNIWTPTTIQGPIFLAISGLTSGTNKSFGPVVVHYR